MSDPMTPLTTEERDILFADALAFDNVQSGWARDSIVAAVGAIVAARVAEALAPIEALAEEWATAYGSPALDPHPLALRHAAALRAAMGSHYEGVSR